MWESFMKLFNRESPAFTNMNINPVFQILGDDRWVSRSCIIVHICPSPIKEITPLMHISHTLQQVGKKFRQGECFSRSKIKSLNTVSHSVGLVTVMVLCRGLCLSNQFTGSVDTWDVAEGLVTAVVLQNHLVNDQHGQSEQRLGSKPTHELMNIHDNSLLIPLWEVS
jgi:hypothetical protein